MSMTEKKDRSIVKSTGPWLLGDITARIKLIWRLMADSRVNPVLKVLPVSTLLYLVFPDLAPGPVDDALIIWLGTYLFVELCPPQVVQEHMANLRPVLGGTVPPVTPPVNTGEIIDVEYWEDKTDEDSANKPS